MTAPHTRIHVGRRRGFALPLVIMLTLVSSILIASMLERQSGQRMTVARQAQSYRETHFGRGVREVLDAWIRTTAGRSVRDSLGTDSKALDMELGDGTTIAVYMFDAQNTLLINGAGLSPDDSRDLAGAWQALRETADRSQLTGLTRRNGPASVSVQSASPEVLAALARQAAGAEHADDLLRELLALRDKPGASPKDLMDAAGTLGLDEDQKRSVSRLFVLEPSYYRVILDARAGGSSPDSRPIARYEAFVNVPTREGGRAKDRGSPSRRTSFVADSWRQIEAR